MNLMSLKEFVDGQLEFTNCNGEHIRGPIAHMKIEDTTVRITFAWHAIRVGNGTSNTAIVWRKVERSVLVELARKMTRFCFRDELQLEITSGYCSTINGDKRYHFRTTLGESGEFFRSSDPTNLIQKSGCIQTLAH